MEDRVMKCATCAFYRVEPGEDYGRCHRYPPIMLISGNQIDFDFPSVNDEDFCGEWQGIQ